ncbi:FAD-dependent oxidoreductase, partial [Candidatus Gracilibacteria bacterium]|nr:FAD-dependent oxidoreductase [Candidatus Gracilibacteria bacterium]
MGLKKAKLTGKTQLTDDVIELHFESLEDFEFKAGQFINIKIEDIEKSCFRAYSIASQPRTDKTFDLCIKVVDGGRASVWLDEIKEGTEISFIGPIGNFVFETPDDKETVFIATGTGIAPFLSMSGEQKGKK